MIFLIFPKKLFFSTELDLICTNNYIDVSLDVKDIFLIINTNNKKIDLGGLSFYADTLKQTESNISWNASNIKLFPDSHGDVSGIIGRYNHLVFFFKISIFNFFSFKYNLIRSVISNSFLFDGFSILEYLITLFVKKYKPTTAMLEIFFLGFSKMSII